MSLVEHAKRELDLFTEEDDQEFKDAILNAVKAFSKYGHSESSAFVGMHILHDLLCFRNLTSLTNDPAEWNEVGDGVWQSQRNSEAFSTNGGKTYYLLSENTNFSKPTKTHRTKKVVK